EAMLDFKVGVVLEGEPLTRAEVRELLASSGGLVLLKGQWVEVDKQKLKEALDHWETANGAAREGGVTFLEAMRMLSGARIAESDPGANAATEHDWSQVAAGQWLSETLAQMRGRAEAGGETADPPGLRAVLRPYQRAGVGWLVFLTELGLGACLADDMGLGKTIQVLGLLLKLRGAAHSPTPPERGLAQHLPSLLVVPASLIGNWKSEIERFTPDLRYTVVHPSEFTDGKFPAAGLAGQELVITTYGMLARLDELRQNPWNLVILDEAQAIKNSGTRQARAVKQLNCRGRIALTGTPVENRLSDLWSLFDFLNPGLLGGATEFGRAVKRMEREGSGFGPLRALVQPYLLRRLKTDRKIIADLPEKTEVRAYCPLSRRQAALYAQAVESLARQLEESDGIQRRGIVLAYLMRFKQICNHPAQWLGSGDYAPDESGKFARLGELCTEMAERQERVLVFTQFREMTAPLSDFLARIFGRAGLVLHGETPVGKRRGMVETFQQEDGPPFFVLSLKAGGTGLNLTAASQVIHFDRWWNPAVENQATDRAFRIGQKKNVLVHKFICRGTLEERIDALIAGKQSLSRDVLEGGAEKLLTEMPDAELLRFVSLDIRHAEQTV
ncbi:MAG TPA: SNF2-related protein, partial [Phycisphaerae bacterium]|nr:SNF2-related protein [Phycisphaerae bacterium]